MKLSFRLSLFLLIILSMPLKAQEAESPTLSVGLESLTFGQGTIDVEALKRVVARKQNELKREGLKRFVFDRLPEYNYTSKLFLQSCILTILEEKNQNIVERELLELSTNYAIVMGFSELMYPYDRKKVVKMPNVERIWRVAVDTSKIEPNLQKQLFIDFMGTVLSKNELLKERGFFDFDSKIDYKYSKLYQHLDTTQTLNNSGFERLDSLLTSRINGYLESYKFIREIVNDKNYDKLKEKKDGFLNEAYRIVGDSTVSNSLNLQGDSEYLRMINLGKELNTFIGETRELNENIKRYNSSRTQLSNLIKKYNDSLKSVKITHLKNLSTAIESEYNILKPLKSELDRKKNTIIKTIDSQKLIASDDELFRSDTYEKIKRIRDQIENLNFPLLSNDEEDSLLNKIRIKIDSSSISSAKALPNYEFGTISSLKNLKPNLDSINSEFNFYKQSVEKSNIGRQDFLRQILNSVNEELISQNIKFEDSISRRVYSKRLSQLYLKSKQIAAKENLSIDDLIYLEKNALPALVELKIIVTDSTSDKKLKKIINATNAAIALSKYLEVDDDLLALNINEEIVSFLNFLGRINELDNASTFAYVLQVLDETHSFIESTYFEDYELKSDGTIDIKTSEKQKSDNLSLSTVYISKAQKKISSLNNESTTRNIKKAGRKLQKAIRKRKREVKKLAKRERQIKRVDQLKQELKEVKKQDQSIDSYIVEFQQADDLIDESQALRRSISKNRSDKFINYQAYKSLYNKLINNIEKYTIIDEENDIIEIDLVSFLESFVESFENSGEKRHFGLYFTVGLSQNVFLDGTAPGELETIGFASEKIGVRYTVFNNEVRKPKNLANKPIQSYEFDKQSPFLNEIYILGYGSGLLYKIADLTTDGSFDAPHVGTGVGFRFFNSLDINATIGFPFLSDEKFGKAPFVGISFDVPIGEYLSAIRGD